MFQDKSFLMGFALTKILSIQEKMENSGSLMTGFDYLRIILSVAVLIWHSLWNCCGRDDLLHAIWLGPLRSLQTVILPMFFALSGFLVSGSLHRTRLYQFIILRCLRLLPALAVEVTLSAVLIGLIFTELPVWEYLTSDGFRSYFLNILGIIHFYLPGVFEHNPGGGMINGQLWTIPFELECYLALTLISGSKLISKRFVIVLIVCGLSIAFQIRVWSGHGLNPFDQAPGRMLVLTFLAAVVIYLYRDRLPYSGMLGVLSGVLSAIILDIPNAVYLAVFPAAYFTIWLGMMRLPKIPFGDLSYGVFLFHWPIQQTIVHLFPSVQTWWLLTIISLPLTAICAWLSWNLIEFPVLSRKRQILAVVDRAWFSISERARLFDWLGRRGIEGNDESL